MCFFFFQAEDGIRDHCVTGVQTCALPIWLGRSLSAGQMYCHATTPQTAKPNATLIPNKIASGMIDPFRWRLSSERPPPMCSREESHCCAPGPINALKGIKGPTGMYS